MELVRTDALSAGVDPRAIIDFLEANQSEQLHSIKLLRHGQVIAEGDWAPYTSDDRRLVYSLSKTFTSAVVGLCVADGLFGYDDTIASHFPEFAEGIGPRAARIRVRDCLAMATGHETDLIEYVGRDGLSLAAVAVLLHTEPTGEPGVTFCYNQIANYTLATLVRRTSGKDVLELLEERILSRLGAPRLYWQRDLEGAPMGFSGLHVDVETIAKFWQLVSQDGVLDGEQVLAPEWVERHRTKQVDNSPGPMTVYSSDGNDWGRGYGWQCWMQSHGYRGDGAFGQYGIMLREHDMVIVITSEVVDMQVTLTNLWTHLLPGIDRPGTAEDQAQLTALLADLSIPARDGELPTEPLSGAVDALTVTTRVDGDELTLLWDEGEAEQTIAVGRGHWRRTELVWPDGHLAVQSSGGMEGDELVVDLRAVNTPHMLTLRLAAGRAETAWRLDPLGGAGSLYDLRLVEAADERRAG